MAKGTIFNVKLEDVYHTVALGKEKICVSIIEVSPNMEMIPLPYPSSGAGTIGKAIETRVFWYANKVSPNVNMPNYDSDGVCTFKIFDPPPSS